MIKWRRLWQNYHVMSLSTKQNLFLLRNMMQHFVKKPHGFWPVVKCNNSPCMYFMIDNRYIFMNATNSSNLFYPSVCLCYFNIQSSILRKWYPFALSNLSYSINYKVKQKYFIIITILFSQIFATGFDRHYHSQAKLLQKYKKNGRTNFEDSLTHKVFMLINSITINKMA